MRQIPALRIGYAGAILRAIAERGEVQLDELLSTADPRALFKGNTQNPRDRAQQLLQYTEGLGLVVRVEGGALELTEAGRRYVSFMDEGQPFELTEAQRDELRVLLADQSQDGIAEGAAVALSLWGSSANGDAVTIEDFGAALAQVGGMDG